MCRKSFNFMQAVSVFLISIFFAFTYPIYAQDLSGKVYEGQTGTEPPPLGNAKTIEGVTVSLYGSDDASDDGTGSLPIQTTTTDSSGWYSLTVRGAYDFYNIVQTNKTDYIDSGATSVGGTVKSSNWIQYSYEDIFVIPVTMTGNKFWDIKEGQEPPENNPPIANDDPVTLVQGPADINVLYNDNDPDGDPLQIISVTNPANGTTVIQGNWIRYTPDPGFKGTDNFDYTVSDGKGGKDTATVTITFVSPGTGTLEGHKFDVDTGEGLENWRIFIDLDSDGQWDSGEPNDTTDSNGYYRIIHIEPGTYRVCEEMQDGWEPASGTVCVEGVNIMVMSVTTQDFHNRRTEGPAGRVIFRGVKYNDLNDNGIKDHNELGLGGWQITLEDGDHNLLSTATTDYDGTYTLTITEPGTYYIDEVQKPGWRQTEPVIGGEPSAYWFLFSELPSYAVIDHYNFGNHETGTEPPERTGSINIIKVATPPDPPVPFDFTGDLGSFILKSGESKVFSQLPPGQYTVTESLPGGDWKMGNYQIAGDSDGGTTSNPTAQSITIDLDAGEDIILVIYNYIEKAPEPGTGSIHGVKFNDLNENGQKDPGEPGISDWEIALTDSNGVVLTTTTTNRNGEYQFDNLEPGIYGVSEEDKQDWFQTFPAEKHYSGVRLSQGEVLMDMDFGNHWIGTEPPEYEYDYGDAPDPSYPTLLASNGARHQIDPRFYLGSSIDSEHDGLPSSIADGDDQDVSNDEDGVSMSPFIAPGQTIPINITSSALGIVNAWLDFNLNGNWSDAGEHIIVGQTVKAGANTFTITVPSNAGLGLSYARFRLSSRRELSYDGEALDGEVEDYAVEIKSPEEGSVTIVKEATPADDTPFLFCADFRPGGFFDTLCAYLMAPSNNTWTINNPSLLEHVSETVPAGWTLTDITITGDTDNGSTIDLSNATVDVDFDEGENIVITFKNVKTGEAQYDFGDAPDSFGTLKINGGPYHDVGQVMFGSSVDAETDGQPGLFADADNDDGVSFPLGLEVNKFAIVMLSVNAPSGALTGIQGWIDYDQSKTFETDEMFTTYHVGTGAPVFQAETIQVPGDAVPGWTYARFRIHDKDIAAGGLSPTGYGGEGEVEDYRIEIKAEGTPAPTGGIVCGHKWNDLDGDGYWEMTHPVDPPLANWTIWLDTNQNGIQDAGDMTTTTDNHGYFQFVGVPAGTYILGEQMEAGWTQTKPGGSGTYNVTVYQGQTTSPKMFGNRQSDGPTFDGRICGSKWNDLNGDGIPDANEPFLADWNIYLDINKNNQFDWGEPNQLTDATGSFEFTGLAVGSYTVAEEMQPGWKQTWPGGTETHIISVPTGPIQPACVMFGNQQIGAGLSLDWGDAPDPNYPTLRASNGAYHVIVPGIFLGGGVDPDADGQPAPDARGDDSDGSDDEDGVAFITPIMPGQQAEVEVVTPSAGYLDAWIDFDADGNWSQASDQIFTSEPILAGSNILSFQVPASIAIDIDTYARLRFSSAGGLALDGAAQDGEVEDYHILLGENGPGVPGEEELPHIKWSQPPIEIDPNTDAPPIFCGWNEPARSTEDSGQSRQWRMDADDFRCLGSIPITRIRWWGGYKSWAQPELPESQPETWHIGIWANQVEGITQDESFIERLIWSVEVPNERVHRAPAGLTEFPEESGETCFVYEMQLEPEEWFHQAEFESNNDVFWITITAIYPADAPQVNQWGWITRPHVWGKGAVMPAIMGDWPTSDERLFPGRIYPIENSLLCGQSQAYDLCFELLTEQPWVKWDQPFTGIREWQDYSDNKSMALEQDGGAISMLRQVADDWLCERQDPVAAIAWNGSYIGYGYEACKCDDIPEPRKPDYFLLSIRANASGTESNNYPGEKIWEFRAENYDEVLVGYDRNPDGEPNEPVFRYSVRLPEHAWFRQETPESIYWLSVVAVFTESSGEIPYDWGWTNHSHGFGSPAMSLDPGSETTPQWQPLPDSSARPVDMSFRLFTIPKQQSPTGQVYYSKSTDDGSMFEPGAIIDGTSAEPAPRINPAIVVDDQGIIHVVWEDYRTDPALANIMYAKSRDGGQNFDQSVMVDDAITVSTHQAKPKMAVDSDGIIHVVWEDYRRNSRLGDIYYAKSTDGGMTFGDDVCVDDLITITSRQINPVIAVDSRRIIHVAWEDYRDNAELGNIYYAQSTDGGLTFGTDIRIDDIFTDTTHQCNPAIAVDPLDIVIIAWEDHRNAQNLGDIYCARSTDGGETFQENLMVEDPITITHRQIRPAVAVDDRGIVYVVWEDYRDNTELGNIYCARSTDGGETFENDVMVDAIYTHTTHQANPAIATAGQGLVHIVWENYRDQSGQANIYYSMSSDEGKAFGEDLIVNQPGPTASSRHNPAIAVDNLGVVHLVWQE